MHIKVRPTESSVRHTGGLPEPLCVAQGVRLGLEGASCFHQRGGGWLQLTEQNIVRASTLHFELIESHERPAYFCWEGPSTGTTYIKKLDEAQCRCLSVSDL